MSWQGEMTTIVRHLLNDLDSSDYKYQSSRIETSILVSVQLITLNITFDNTYTVGIEDGTLSPDPTETDPRDNALINLACLHTACIILQGEIRKESGSAISIKDGPSSIDMRGVPETLAKLYKSVCEKYEQALLDYRAGNLTAAHIIIGPYSPGSDYVSNTALGHREGGAYFNY